MLNDKDLVCYRANGHLTVDGVFSASDMDAAIADALAWADAELAAMDDERRGWYVDAGVRGMTALRKLDNPVALRPVFAQLAARPELTDLVRQIIGDGLKVVFSQIFFKAPGGGGPKPVHQDNYYFGPGDPDGLVTAWIALDDADVENGCLYYADGSHRGGLLEHAAPPGQPFNLLIPEEIASAYPMTPAPVRKGGVSFHHGGTLHQSSDNRSQRWRRACAIHYVNGSTVFETPALPYDDDLIVAIDEPLKA